MSATAGRMMRIRMRIIPALAVTLAAAVFPLAAQATTRSPGSWAGAIHNVRVSSGTSPVTDTPLAVDPTNRDHMMTAGYGGGDGCATASAVGVYASNDRGRTWLRRCMLPGGDGDAVAGEWVAYGPDGTAYAAAAYGAGTTVAVEVQRSSDNGLTWSLPVLATPAIYGFAAYEPVIEVDTHAASPFLGRIYVVALQDDDGDNGITVSRSNDRGVTWKTVTVVTGFGMHGHPALTSGPDGTVYLSYVRCTNWNGWSCTRYPADLDVMTSADGGVTWSGPVRVAQFVLPRGRNFTFGKLRNTKDQLNDLASIAVDGTNGPFAGRVYLAVHARIQETLHVELFTSADGGTTWSGPVLPAPPDTPNDQFMPSIAVSASGTVAVTWLDRRNDPTNLRYEAYSAVSIDGGATFGPNRRMATAASNPRRSGFQQYMGSYGGAVWSGETLYAAWPDTRSGSAQVEVGWR